MLVATLLLAFSIDVGAAPSVPEAQPPGRETQVHSSMTQLAYDVGIDGKPKNCRVIVSSGSAELDGKACQILMEKASFQLARDARGRPVEQLGQTLSIRWNITE